MTTSDPETPAAPVPQTPGEFLADLERRHDEVLVELGRLEAEVERVLVDWTGRDASAPASTAAPGGPSAPPRSALPGAASPRSPARRNRSA